jgi:hypothetical protein
MESPASSPAHRLGESFLRIGCGVLGFVMFVILARFLRQFDSLRLFTLPESMLFFLFGYIRPSVGLYPLIFALPLVGLIPFVQGVANFSLIEIGWWALCVGRLTRRAVDPKPLIAPPQPAWPLLWLLTIVLCGSAAVRLAMNHLWTDSLIYQLLWERLGDFFRWSQESRLFPLRAAAVWLEGVAFLALVRRNALREAFQRRARVLLILSLTVVLLTSLHQFALGLLAAGGSGEPLAAWQVQPDWLPQSLLDRWPGLHAVHGLWPDVNSFASYLLMAFPLVLSTFVLSRNVFARALLLILGVLNVIVLGLTFSRIACLWLPVVIVVWALLSRSRTRRLWAWLERGGRRQLMIALGLVLIVLAAVVGTDRGVAATEALAHSAVGEHLNVALKGRLNIWQTALRAAHTDPLFGVGYGGYYDQSAFFHRWEDDHTSWGEEIWNPIRENAHSQFLQILVETGLLGFALAALLMGQWARFALRVAAWGRGGDRWMVRGLLTSVFALGGTLLTGHALLVIEMLLFFWTLVGLAFVPARGPRAPDLPTVPPPWSGRAQVGAVALVLIVALRLWGARGAPDLLAYGSGFYPPERDPRSGLDYQWTRDRATLLLRNIQGECAFYLSNARPDQNPVTVEIFIDGELRARVTPPDYHWWPYRFEAGVPPNAVYRLELHVLETYRNAFDPVDKVLGIRFRGLSY